MNTRPKSDRLNRKEKETTMISNPAQPPFDIHANSLLATIFSHPSEVLSDPILSTAEKRCIFAAWASDAFAVEGSPWLRQLPGSPHAVPVSEIFAALRDLDDVDPPPVAGVLRVPVVDEPALAVGF
jgi:hypothetical protein